MSAGGSLLGGGLSFRRIIDIPLEACVTALENGLRAGPGNELHLGRSLLRGPVEHDRDWGTCRIEARLARGPLRPLLPMRLHIDRWSGPAGRTALELIPGTRVRPAAAYFRAGHLLLDALTRRLVSLTWGKDRTPPGRAARSDGLAVSASPAAPSDTGPGHEEVPMQTLVVQMSLDPARAEEAARHVRQDFVGWARRQPGFVAGQWLRSPDGRAGLGVVVFASEDSAARAAQGPRSYPRDDDRAWNIEGVTVYQQLTTA
jgi:hypothetical protein